MRRAELGFALLVVLVMAGAWTLDGLVPSRSIATPVAVSAPGAPLSEAWYCPAPTAQGLGSTLWTANLGAQPVHVRRSGTGASGAQSEADLGPDSSNSAPAAATAPEGPTAVEAFGQATGSYLSVLTPSAGAASSRCSQQPGTRWIFPIASTAPGYDTYLAVTNPFQEEAQITVRVLGAKGDQIPSGLNNVDVPQLSQTTLFLGDFYPATASVGLDVTATRGRVVVGRLMKVSSREGVRGLTLDVGATAPSTRWLVPGGDVPAQGEEDVVVANPSDHEALISTAYQTESGGAPAGAQDVPVPAGSQATLKISDQVPGGTRHATVVSSTNGVPVVVERLTVGPQNAYQTVLGAPGTAARWLVAAGSTAGGTDTLALIGEGPNKVTCKVTILSGTGPNVPGPLAGVEVTPGQRGSVDLTQYLNGQPAMVLVEATGGKVAVENDLALPATYRQTVETAGIPLG